MKKAMIAFTAAALVASTVAMAQGSNSAGGATMQRNTAMTANQMYQYRYQTQTKNMYMQQGEGDKYEHKNAYSYEHKNGSTDDTVVVDNTVTTGE